MGMSELKQAVLEGPRKLTVREADIPTAGPGEVLIEVKACGICGSDVHAYTGNHPFVLYPVVPGHEFTGIVRTVGESVPESLVGERVCVEPSLFCGFCPQCKSSRYNICSNLKVLGFQADGAMSEFVAVPSHRLHSLPPGVTYEAGALAEPAAVAVHALSRSGVGRGELLLVIGAGVIGKMLIRAARARGCRVACVETDRERASQAALAGADPVFLGGETSAVDIASAGGGDIKAIVECVGSRDALDLAVSVAPRGSTIVVAGVFPGAVPVQVALIQDGELEVKGTLMYMGDDFERALELLATGEIEPSQFITHEFNLDEIEEAYRVILSPDEPTMKVLIKPWESA